MSIDSFIFFFFFLHFDKLSLADIHIQPRNDFDIEDSFDDDRVVIFIIPPVSTMLFKFVGTFNSSTAAENATPKSGTALLGKYKLILLLRRVVFLW